MITPKALLNNTVDRPGGARRLRPASARCDRSAVPPPQSIDHLNVTGHIRQILRTIVTISAQEAYTEILAWIHTLGYRGHVVSKSRQFSAKMTALRECRRAWRQSQIHDNPSAESRIPQPIWQFDCVGHTSLGDRVLAVSAFGRAREQRLAAQSALTEGARTMNSADFGVELHKAGRSQ
jgi:hypothetical protein